MEQRPLADRVAAASGLNEPIRRALFEHVARSDTPVGRDDAAEVGPARSSATFHLGDQPGPPTGVASFHDSFQHMRGSLHARARQLNRR